MRLRSGKRRYRLLVLLTLGGWALTSAAPGGLPTSPPDWGQLLATLLTAIFAVACGATLGLQAGAELALGGAGRAEAAVRAFLQAAAAIPSVALGAVLLVVWADVLHLASGVWLAALGLAVLNLPSGILLAAEGFSGHSDIADAARALGASASQTAQAVFPAVRREVAHAILLVFSRALGEAGIVALLAGPLTAQGTGALRAGATVAAGLWYLEMQGRAGTSQAFWPVVLLLLLAALAAGAAELFYRRRQEGLSR